MTWEYVRYDPHTKRPPFIDPLIVKKGQYLPESIYLSLRTPGYLYVLPVVDVDQSDMASFYESPKHEAVIQELRRKWAELSLRMEKAGVEFHNKYDVLKQLGMEIPDDAIPF